MDTKTTFIYALCEPGTRTVRYIGKTNNPRKRFKQHLKDSTKVFTHLGNWLRFLVSRSETPELVILREVPFDQWEIAEERYIRLARGCGMSLVNSTDGGEGVTMTPEIREKISVKNRGENHGNFGKIPWNFGKRGGVAWNLGKTTPPEVREKQSAAKLGKRPHNFGKPRSAESICRQKATIARNKTHGQKDPSETLARRKKSQRQQERRRKEKESRG